MYTFRCALTILCLGMASSVSATVGCSVTPLPGKGHLVPLHEAPNEAAEVLRTIPRGDIVMLPQEDLAPAQREGWVWVRHDITQVSIWQSGLYGWVRKEALSDCG